MNCCTGFKRLERNLRFTHSNFEMEASHVVTHMIFHAITADQNARIRLLHRRVSGKSTGKSVCAKSYDRQNEARGTHRSPHWI